MLIDTHCHLASHHYAQTSMQELAARSRELGVTHCVSLGTHRPDWETQLELAAAMPDYVSACLAIHPTEAHLATPEDMELLQALGGKHALAAIGEAGLDYFHPAPEGCDEAGYHALQRDLLERHFAIAETLGLNISIHTRDRKGSASFDDAVAIARNFPRVKPVFHCFIGDRAQAETIFSGLDGMISVTGIVTFRNGRQVQDVAAWCPLDRLMVETDAPYLSPEPYRGCQNEPGRVRYVADKIAALRGLPVPEVEAATTANARRFFRLPDHV